jgi:hypothetical protein
MTAEAQRLDNGCATPHKWIKYLYAVCIGVIGMIIVKLLHDVCAGRLHGGQEYRPEYAGCPAGKPFMHLIDGFEGIAFRYSQSVDFDDGK